MPQDFLSKVYKDATGLDLNSGQTSSTKKQPSQSDPVIDAIRAKVTKADRDVANIEKSRKNSRIFNAVESVGDFLPFFESTTERIKANRDQVAADAETDIQDVIRSRDQINRSGGYGRGGYGAAVERGLGNLQATGGALGIATGFGDEEDIGNIIEGRNRSKTAGARNQSEQEAYERFQAADGFVASAREIFTDFDLLTNIAVESLPSSLPSMVGGAVAGVVGGVVTRSGEGAQRAAGVGTGLGSFVTEYGNTMLETFEKNGVDLDDPEALKAAMTDKELMSEARQRATRRGIAVGAFDGMSVILGGRMGGAPVAKKIIGDTAKAGIGRKATGLLAAGAVETVGQGTLGAAGEAAGQLAADGRVTSPQDIVAEFAGEIPSGVVESIGGTAVQLGKGGNANDGDISNENLDSALRNNIQGAPTQAAPLALPSPERFDLDSADDTTPLRVKGLNLTPRKVLESAQQNASDPRIANILEQPIDSNTKATQIARIYNGEDAQRAEGLIVPKITPLVGGKNSVSTTRAAIETELSQYGEEVIAESPVLSGLSKVVEKNETGQYVMGGKQAVDTTRSALSSFTPVTPNGQTFTARPFRTSQETADGGREIVEDGSVVMTQGQLPDEMARIRGAEEALIDLAPRRQERFDQATGDGSQREDLRAGAPDIETQFFLNPAVYGDDLGGIAATIVGAEGGKVRIQYESPTEQNGNGDPVIISEDVEPTAMFDRVVRGTARMTQELAGDVRKPKRGTGTDLNPRNSVDRTSTRAIVPTQDAGLPATISPTRMTGFEENTDEGVFSLEGDVNNAQANPQPEPQPNVEGILEAPTARQEAPAAEAPAPKAPAAKAEPKQLPPPAKPEYTPKEIADNLTAFSGGEARARDLDEDGVSMFREGVSDVARGKNDFLTREQIEKAADKNSADAYEAGVEWAKQKQAEAAAVKDKSADRNDDPNFSSRNNKDVVRDADSPKGPRQVVLRAKEGANNTDEDAQTSEPADQQDTTASTMSTEEAQKTIDEALEQLRNRGQLGEEAAAEIQSLLDQKALSADEAIAAFRMADVATKIIRKKLNVKMQFVPDLRDQKTGEKVQGSFQSLPLGGDGFAGVLKLSLAKEWSSIFSETAAHETFHVLQKVLQRADPKTFKLLNASFKDDMTLNDIHPSLQRMFKNTRHPRFNASVWDVMQGDGVFNNQDGTQRQWSGYGPDKDTITELQAYVFGYMNDAIRYGASRKGLAAQFSNAYGVFTDFLEAVNNAVKGLGFTSTSKLWRDAASGELSQRAGDVDISTNAGGDTQFSARKGGAKVEGEDKRISTRFPTAKKSTEDALKDNLIVGMESMKADPQVFAYNMELVKSYPDFKTDATDPNEIAEDFLAHVESNLLYLHDLVPVDKRARARKWYDGARNIVDRWMQKYDVSEDTIAGVLAALSPQKDWFMNVSLGERVLDVMDKAQDFVWDSRMDEKAREKFDLANKPKLKAVYELAAGKALKDIDDITAKAMFVRIYDETFHDRAHRIVNPEGTFSSWVRTLKGEKSGTGWGSFVEIGKAIAVIVDPSPENISRSMGDKHKVRNFFNNIVSPLAPFGDVTIDTHAVAAALLRPLSGASLEVNHNFGTTSEKGMVGTKNSSVTGNQGLYGLYAEAYRRAAEKRGVLPREMQSITWEAVRSFYTAGFKNNKKKIASVDAVWSKYKNGELTLDKARSEINEIAGGLEDFAWDGPRGTDADEAGDSSYAGELSGSGVSGRTAGGVDGGTGRAASGRASEPDGVNYSARSATPQFKAWFGDSKVVDEAGNPLTVYHGTSKDTIFKSFKIGSRGSWFTADPMSASQYAEENDSMNLRYNNGRYDKVNTKSRVIPVNLKIENPKVYEGNELRDETFARGGDRYERGEAALFRELLADGYDGVQLKLDDGDIWVALKDPRQIKSIFNQPVDPKSVQYSARRSVPTGPPIASGTQRRNAPKFASGPSRIGPDTRSARRAYWEAKYEKYVNRALPIKQLVKQINDEFNDSTNFARVELLMGSRLATQTRDFHNEEVTPLLREASARGLTLEEVEKYLHAKHAIERNPVIAERNELFPDGGAGISTADARSYLASLSDAKTNALEAVGQKVGTLTDKTLQLMVESGSESQEAITALRERYKNWVPLFREGIDGGNPIGGGTRGASVEGSSLKYALGSDKPVVNIIANIITQREAALNRAENNRLSGSVRRSALEYPDPAFWMVIDPSKVTLEGLRQQLVNMGMDPDFADDIYKAPRKAAYNKKTGMVESVVDNQFKRQPNVVATRVEGTDQYTIFNPNDEMAMRVASMLRNDDLPVVEGISGATIELIGPFTRIWSQMRTQYMPEFGPVNFVRDLENVLINLADTPLKGEQGSVFKSAIKFGNFFARKNNLLRVISNVDDGSNANPADRELSDLFARFEKAGGRTSIRNTFFQTNDPKKIEKQMQAAMKQVASGKTSAPKAVVEAVVAWNDMLENATRLAVFKTAIDNGLTDAQAADLAKTTTVNFQQKGTETKQLNAYWGFFNASVAGTNRNMQVMLSGAGKKIALWGVGLGILQGLMLQMAGYEEDEPPEWVKDNAFTIPIPYTDKFFPIPMLHFYRVFPNIGRRMVEVAAGDLSVGGFLGGSLKAVITAVNPIAYGASFVEFVSPSILDMGVQYWQNQDGLGRRIYNDNFSELSPTTGMSRARGDTTVMYAMYSKIAEGINAISGGDDYVAGRYSPTPEEIKFFTEQAAPPLQFVYRVFGVAEKGLSGEDVEANELPFLRRFYGEKGGRTAEGARFYENVKQINIIKTEIKERKEAGQDLTPIFEEEPLANLADGVGKYYRNVSDLRRERRILILQGASAAEIKAKNDEITTLMKQFNDLVKETEGQE